MRGHTKSTHAHGRNPHNLSRHAYTTAPRHFDDYLPNSADELFLVAVPKLDNVRNYSSNNSGQTPLVNRVGDRRGCN